MPVPLSSRITRTASSTSVPAMKREAARQANPHPITSRCAQDAFGKVDQKGSKHMFPFSQSAFRIVAQVPITPVLYFFATKVTFWRPVAKSQCKHLVARIRDLSADHCDLPDDLFAHQLQSTTQQLPCRDDHRRAFRSAVSTPRLPPSACCRSTPLPSRSATARDDPGRAKHPGIRIGNRLDAGRS